MQSFAQPTSNLESECANSFCALQFPQSSAITQKLRQPAVKVPPPVLKEDGRINEEYFSVLAAKGGPYIKNAPPTFREDHAGMLLW